jgi:indole-3-glycerol phosphate synthase
MSGLLERIVQSKRAEVAGGLASAGDVHPRSTPSRDVVGTLRRRRAGLAPSESKGGSASLERAMPGPNDASRGPGPARGVREPLRLIAEIKFQSPSAGRLSRALGPAARAVEYAKAGAAMVSVLCDGPFFGGSWEDLKRVRETLDESFGHVPVLAKEFVIDVTQLDCAKAHGADAVLIIARIARTVSVATLVCAARDRELEPLVEVTDDGELAVALASGASLIGVNARDLDTLALDGERAARVLSAVPDDRVAIYLSGIKSPRDVTPIAQGRADAALVGETLMRTDDPGPRLRELVRAATTP